MSFHDTVGLADRAQLEIVRPSSQPLVDGAHDVLDRQVQPPPTCHLTDGATNALHRCLPRSHSKIGPPPSKRVARADGVTHKLKRLAPPPMDPSLPPPLARPIAP